jgi:hypothetical protein
VARIERYDGEPFPRVGLIVADLTGWLARVVRPHNCHGAAGQWIRTGQYAVRWARLSCHDPSEQRLREDGALSDPLRRAALNEVLRQGARQRSDSAEHEIADPDKTGD